MIICSFQLIVIIYSVIYFGIKYLFVLKNELEMLLTKVEVVDIYVYVYVYVFRFFKLINECLDYR